MMILRTFLVSRAVAGRLCVAALLLVSFIDAPAQQPFVHANDVAFSIWPDQKQYRAGDTIEIRYTIKNVSNGPLFVPRSQWDSECGSPPHFWAALEDSSGKHFEPGYAGSCLGSVGERPMLSKRMAKDAVILKPGQSISGHFNFQTHVFAQLKPGAYRVEATLYGWNSSYIDTDLRELSKMGAPFLIGETHATVQIQFTPAAH